MRIDERVEGRLRECYSGAIAKDSDLITAALAGITKEDTAHLLGLGLFVVGFVVKDVLREDLTDESIRDLADKIVTKQADWIDLGDASEVTAFLKAAATGDRQLAGLGGEDITGLVIVCGAHLLNYYRLDGQRWFQYLDEIWSILESTPEPTSQDDPVA
ncbi:hypothetical protein [Micromonospora zhanjiangensis]|uniref:Uncharacterized protein n=1 Tax=Micromonospora zhanjiangensis TaxID=1522057 RepID=A0ABV8KY34_9ACTN